MDALVIDDSSAMQVILGRMLTELGFHCVAAKNGREALMRLREFLGIQLVLVDWNMPEMNGLEFIQVVRADRHFDRVKLVVVSAETRGSQLVRALDEGADEYIMKPFTKVVLAEKLQLLGLGS